MNWAYIKYEDSNTTVFVLDKGVKKLAKYGLPTFLKYAYEVELSYCDINRVISKARLSYGKTKLKEIPCPPEMRQKRWDYYTRNLGYSDKKAREMIKDIDNLYYGTQPIPDPNVNKLVSTVARGV